MAESINKAGFPHSYITHYDGFGNLDTINNKFNNINYHN